MAPRSPPIRCCGSLAAHHRSRCEHVPLALTGPERNLEAGSPNSATRPHWASGIVDGHMPHAEHSLHALASKGVRCFHSAGGARTVLAIIHRPQGGSVYHDPYYTLRLNQAYMQVNSNQFKSAVCSPALCLCRSRAVAGPASPYPPPRPRRLPRPLRSRGSGSRLPGASAGARALANAPRAP